MIDTFAKGLKREIQGRIDSLDNALVAGSIQTMEDYRFVTGQRRGLEAAMFVIDELLEAAERE